MREGSFRGAYFPWGRERLARGSLLISMEKEGFDEGERERNSLSTDTLNGQKGVNFHFLVKEFLSPAKGGGGRSSKSMTIRAKREGCPQNIYFAREGKKTSEEKRGFRYQGTYNV